MFVKLHLFFVMMGCLLLAGCDFPWNDPYPQFEEHENILYTVFTERPKHLDPAISYSADEAIFTYQIYEPLLQYHYLKRPFELIPLTTEGMPQVRYLNPQGETVEENSDSIAYSIYKIQIKPHIFYQDHPAFAKIPGTDRYQYHHLTQGQVRYKHKINDFRHTATRELVAADYIYEIKRLADPAVNSPVYGVMENYIVGFKAFSTLLQAQRREKKNIDLRMFPLLGVKEIDRYTFEITVKGKYPQFLQWLAMPFFAPVPWEAVAFYSQPILQKRNITLDWYPVGTGPFILSENNPNMMMVLEKNKNFHGETYPTEGEPGDEIAGFLKNKGKPLPLLDKVVFILEKEDIPYWNKFLQGYYDQSGISNNNFDQALKSMNEESIELSDELQSKKITLNRTVLPTVFYWGVNMLDETVGGYSEKNKKLRQALSLAFNIEEYISIFLNGRGEIGHTPLPEGIFGYRKEPQTNITQQEKIKQARKILAEAGYPNGIHPTTHQPLSLSMDVVVSTGPDASAMLSWFRKQFEQLGIELVIKATQYSRFQDKMLNGDAQIFTFGWSADYPDPENFFFLFDTENGKVKYRGENASNYSNAIFDRYFYQMKTMNNSPARQALIDKMNLILEEDLPWLASYYPIQFSLKQQWVNPSKPNPMARNTLKYISLDPGVRSHFQKKWNPPIIWPVVWGSLVFVVLCIPAGIVYWRKTHRPLILKKSKGNLC